VNEMSPSMHDLGPAVGDSQGDGTSNLGDTTATVMAHIHVSLKDMPGVTIRDKFDTLMSKLAAAKELLGGLEPDVLLQARIKVDEPERELSKSPALLKAYEQISKNTHGTLTRSKRRQILISTVDASAEEVSEDDFETAMLAGFAAVEEFEACEEHTLPQYPPPDDVHRISQPPEAQYAILSAAS